VGQEGEMTQALYAHMNNKIIKKNIRFLTCIFVIVVNSTELFQTF
jgi:hypothetical protein